MKQLTLKETYTQWFDGNGNPCEAAPNNIKQVHKNDRINRLAKTIKDALAIALCLSTAIFFML